MTLINPKRQGLLATENLLPLFVLLALGLGGLNLLLTAVLGMMTSQIARKPVPTLVQTIDGNSFTVKPIDNLDRTPESIRLFTRQAMTMLFTWNGVSQAQDATGTIQTTTDAGVKAGSNTVTTKAWQASFSLSEDFRASFLEQVGALTPRSVFQGQAQSVFNIESLSEPLLIAPGFWDVTMVANLIIFDAKNPGGIAIPVNKVIRIQAVEPPSDPMEAEATAVQRAVYQVRSAGLQITDITEMTEAAR